MLKTFSICHPNTPLVNQDGYYEHVIINGEKILVGLIDIKATTLPKYKEYDEFVLVEKKAFSCNYRDKLLMLNMMHSCVKRSKDDQYYHSGFGSDFVGKVIEIGSKVKAVKIGDRVIPDSTYPIRESGILGGIPSNFASQRQEILHQSQVIKIPDEISDEIAASLTISAQTIYSMLRKLRIESGMNVLVTAGSSNTSLLAIQILRKMTLNLYVATTNVNYTKITEEWGIRTLININDRKIHINAFGSKFKGFDIVIDPFFDVYFDNVFHLLKNGGQYITCGLHNQGKFEKNTDGLSKHEIFVNCILKNISIIGNCLGNENDIAQSIKDYSLGKINLTIDSVYEGTKIHDFINRTFNSKDRFGKVVYKYK